MLTRETARRYDRSMNGFSSSGASSTARVISVGDEFSLVTFTADLLLYPVDSTKEPARRSPPAGPSLTASIAQPSRRKKRVPQQDQRFQSGGLNFPVIPIFPVIPAFPSFQFSPSFRFSAIPIFLRHSGESRNLRAAMHSVFHRSDGSTPFRLSVILISPVIPIFSRHSGESRNLRAAMHSGFRRSDGSTPFRFFRHSNFLPSFRRKPESTRCDGLRLSPKRRIHT